MLSYFYTPAARKVAARKLEEAKLDLLEAQARVENAEISLAENKATVTALKARIERLGDLTRDWTNEAHQRPPQRLPESSPPAMKDEKFGKRRPQDRMTSDPIPGLG